jgi:hypothetical protein
MKKLTRNIAGKKQKTVRKKEPVPLEEDVPGIEHADNVSANPSQAQDRGEDLMNEDDPFLQQAEKNGPEGNLADLFEAERQSRRKSPF